MRGHGGRGSPFALLVAMAVALLSACGGGPSPADHAAAERYLDRALALLAQNSMDINQTSWPHVVSQAKTQARHAQSPADTYAAIRFAIASLGDPHTQFLTPTEASAFNGTTAPHYDGPSGRMLPGHLAYLQVGSFEGDEAAIAAYVRTGVASVERLNANAPCGWVVDLRGNDGGNVWPMLTTVAPLLVGNPVGYFVNTAGQRLAWDVRAGRLYVAGAATLPQANPTRLRQPHPPVALLTDYNTASAGEAVAVAFRGQPDSRSFGTSTAGFATGNRVISLSDGAILLITGVYDADRTGHIYRTGDRLQPDVYARPAAQRPGQPPQPAPPTQALEWLRQSAPCR